MIVLSITGILLIGQWLCIVIIFVRVCIKIFNVLCRILDDLRNCHSSQVSHIQCCKRQKELLIRKCRVQRKANFAVPAVLCSVYRMIDQEG